MPGMRPKLPRFSQNHYLGMLEPLIPLAREKNLINGPFIVLIVIYILENFLIRNKNVMQDDMKIL